jgi:hypothetical protein
MKTNNILFDNLVFDKHPGGWRDDALQATHTFENGYSISVVTGGGLYGDINEQLFKDSTFEVAAFDPDRNFIKLTLHDDVKGHQSADEVSEIMVTLCDDPDSLRVDECSYN